MKTFLLTFVLLFGALSLSSQDDELSVEKMKQMVQFDKHWGKFLMEMLGCYQEMDKDMIAKPLTRDDCSEDKAILDYGEYMKARTLAKKVFNLDEPIQPDTKRSGRSDQ